MKLKRKIKRKIITFFLAFIMMIAIIPSAGILISAQEEPDFINNIIKNSIILRIGSTKASVNGEIKYIDRYNRNITPFIDENSRTLVPVRFIAENLNWTVDYDEQTRQITLSNPLLRPIHMTVDSNIFVYDNQKHFIDSTPILYKDRTFIPLRAFVEMALKKNISYIDSERIIIISDIEISSAKAKKVAEEITNKFPVWPLDMDKVQKEWKNWPQYEDDEEYHSGTDFAVPIGSNVYSVYSGTVDIVADSGDESYGKYIAVKSVINGNDRYIYYAHLDEQFVKQGDKVYAGYIIGKSGNTGFSEGPHLHYEVRNAYKSYGSIDNPTLNPYDYLP